MPHIKHPSPDALVFSVPQFLSAYGISRDTYYREVKEGRLAVAKIGDRRLIAKSEGERWFKERMVRHVK